jgi:hypothetical protein
MVKFQNNYVSGVERSDCTDTQNYGKGFYNEFGIDTPLGFEEAAIGGWFHKIGVGILKKDAHHYFFHKDYEVKPAEFKISTEPNKILINCISNACNGYSYLLRKEIELCESSFIIKYHLQNTGDKDIITDEYNHNFLAINKDFIGSNYILKFPFPLNPELFGETVNPEGKVAIGKKEIEFNGTPNEQFFFSNLTGGENVDAGWELTNSKSKIGIRETGNFQTTKINLWGWKHVISPELFFNIFIKPGQSIGWSRAYKLFNET